MKLCGLSLLLVIILGNSLITQSDVMSPQKTELNATISDLKIDAKNLHLMLSELAYKYSVPVSLEVATNDDLSKSKCKSPSSMTTN